MNYGELQESVQLIEVSDELEHTFGPDLVEELTDLVVHWVDDDGFHPEGYQEGLTKILEEKREILLKNLV